MINVSKPNLPDLEKYIGYLKGIWDRNWLTNNGPLVNELEMRLKEYLDVPHLLFLGNGTIALQIAIKALELKGEVITTPFSYVATTSSLVWENCKPVFVDIDKTSFNIDPAKIEAAITENTTGILATHVFGNPCEIDEIKKIADKHNLKVIYDAAHCFGTKYKGKSVFSYGDISTTSFHATKLFHSIEGGAVFTNSAELLKKMSYLRNFGHNGPEDFEEAGINGKNSEFHAAMGLANLELVDKILASRKLQSDQYNKILSTLNVKSIAIEPNSQFNFAYFPILFSDESSLLKAVQVLNGHNIVPRRYFYPSLNTLKYLERQEVPVSEDISKRILCLPLYYGLSKEEIDFIARLLLRAQNN